MEISQTLYDFIAKHANDDVNALRLKYSAKNSQISGKTDLNFALTQIEARKKSRKKIPGFISNPKFLFPSLVASEQASNEAVARFHASLIIQGSSLLDLTAGLGIDDMTFANSGIDVTACEIDTDKCEVLSHNSFIMGVMDKIRIINEDSMEFLSTDNCRYDVIFADPARRDSQGRRLHALADCMPDVLTNMNLILAHTDRLIVKSSPLLDLSLIINTVEKLNHIYIVCFRGECKEVLIEINNSDEFTGVTCMDLDWDHVISEFHVPSNYFDKHQDFENSEKLYLYQTADKRPSPIDYKYMYEPNAAVMKTGAWTTLMEDFPDLIKADRNTHLFFSDSLYQNFPGRKLEILTSFDKKSLKRLKGSRMNVVARNYPLNAAQICSKYGIISGTDQFLYAFRYDSKPIVITASEIPKF